MTCQSAPPSASSPHFCFYLSGSRLGTNFILGIIPCVQVLAKDAWQLVIPNRWLKESPWGGHELWAWSPFVPPILAWGIPALSPKLENHLFRMGLEWFSSQAGGLVREHPRAWLSGNFCDLPNMRITENPALTSLKWVSRHTQLEAQVFCGFILLELLFCPIG